MAASSENSLSLFSLSALVIGSMIGVGIFFLPGTFTVATGPFGALFAWCVAAGAMYTLARADFGGHPGSLSAFVAALSHAACHRKTVRSFDGWASIRRGRSQ